MRVSAFFDESGDLELRDVFTIGGLAGPPQHWGDFSDQWRAVLQANGVDDFHMSEFENRRGIFRDWEESRKRALLAPLVELIVDLPVVAFGVSLHLERWSGLPEHSRRDWVDPYLVVFQVAVQKLAQMSKSLGEDHVIDFTFDTKTRFQAKAQNALDRLRQDEDLAGREKFGTLSFGDRRSNSELQAADLWVYELRKYDLNQMLGRPRPTRWPMTQLRRKQQKGQLIVGDVSFGLPEPPAAQRTCAPPARSINTAE